ncbi:G2/M phase-specific E3 ubiquitin-protein ligase [Danio rerio]|uniref:G2/M phase-specific E3 ubiquitin-protein ligase n=2 Tax=Danio rerio TaxID=7955 RepID=Q8AW58_DANRE|nr:G2/M phase-specific E3 ubiquitin-protein ligase [Danio rerio]CAD58745.1 novel protein similar to KIAA1333 [Danio rerio]CAD61085.1 novel protein similar to KIAA1333 [Danio rerio]|eukprot:NP_001003822.1 G2/M phase-specific E3 ubiquitin-protein ligase [Danio rerio]
MKALNEKSAEIKLQDRDLICCLCKRSENNKEKYGEKVHLEQHNLAVHFFCLLMSSGICQRGEEDEDVYGFLVGDIKKEIRRSSRLRCFHCKKAGASVGCSIKSCRQMVHMPCGLEQEFVFQFTGLFPSFCKKHAPTQSCDSSHSLPHSCSICLDPIEPILSYHVLKCPACHGSWFHRKCVQNYAHSAAMFFFKCTLCNNKEQFQQEMLRMGIYIPERDASWELEENAFVELLQVYHRCDAVKCLCHKGREHSSQSGYFEIVLCKLCGSRGTHRKCSNIRVYEADWMCADCKTAAEGKTSLPLPNHVESPLAIRQERKRLFKSISDIHSSIVAKRQCVPATSPEVLMDLACQISQQQFTEVLVGDDDGGVMEAALQVLRQSDFNPCCTLSVKFSKDKLNNNIRNQRRFLRRLVSKLQVSDIFEGSDGAKNLALNSKALRDDLYFDVGSLLALSLVHGGPPLGFFSPALYHSLFNYPKNYRPTLEDLGDTAFGHKIRQIAEAKSMKELRHAMKSASQYLEAAGCWRKISKLSEKDMLVEDVLNFYLIIRLQLPLQRFREGLRTLGMFEQVQMCSETFFPVFCGPVERLTAESVMELFTTRLSEEKEKQVLEKTTISFWKQYLHECEEGQCAASLEDLLTFATGTDLVPAIGFKPTPSISFLSSPDNLCAFPQSNCDANHLILPTLPSYQLFKKHLDYTVCQFSVMQDI